MWTSLKNVNVWKKKNVNLITGCEYDFQQYFFFFNSFNCLHVETTQHNTHCHQKLVDNV